mmetsp:Transcript_30919/g.100669  ORF Transcript_30919/g.100669 Transcript_30919/m.100669 type:complete len:335 (+) Transcript_30919:35-1039(+)
MDAARAYVPRLARAVRLGFIGLSSFSAGASFGMATALDDPDEVVNTIVMQTLQQRSPRGGSEVIILPSEDERLVRATRVGDRILSAARTHAREQLSSAEELGLDEFKVAGFKSFLKRQGWRIVSYESTEINAFVLSVAPNMVFLSSGLLDKFKDDSELAFVIGHELSHLQLEHSRAELYTRGLTSGLQLMLASLIDPSGGIIAGPILEATLYHLLSTAEQLGVLLPLSRHQEYEADALGVGFAARACFDPKGGTQALTKLHASNGGFELATSIMSTHPQYTERIAALEAETVRANELFEQSGCSYAGKFRRALKQARKATTKAPKSETPATEPS